MSRWRRTLTWILLTLSLHTSVCYARPSIESSTEGLSIYTSNAASHIYSITLPLHANPPKSVAPRDHGFQHSLNMGGGWNLYYSSWPSSIFPVQPAIWALRQLYTSMVVNGGSIWRLSPPRYEIPLRVGNVFLLMESDQPIEWDVVMTFGTKLLSYLERGFTGLYGVMLSNAQHDATILVTLKILERP